MAEDLLVLGDDHSDDSYIQGLQLDEALMASLFTSPNPGDAASSVAHQANPSKQQPEEAEHVIKEVGESSLKFCEICMERKENDQVFTVESCKHSICTDCIHKYVETEVMHGVHVVNCPAADCKGVLDFDSCTSVLSKDSLAKWNEVLCRSQVLDSQKFYCPYEDCSAMLVRDTDEMIRMSECPECRRLFCAQCRVPWHPGIGCEEFQNLIAYGRERKEINPWHLSKIKKWNKCSFCKLM